VASHRSAAPSSAPQVYTLLLEILRPSTVASLLSWLPPGLFDPLNKYVISHLGILRMIIMPLLLVLVMIFWPRGIMGSASSAVHTAPGHGSTRPESSVGA
jgi:hypothetical protein